MIRTLLAARYVLFAALVLLVAVLALWGRRVGYEQSINSFFADDDPDMLAYQRAARTFGDDNLVFVMYEDPELLTPAGIDRVAELAAAIAPERIEAVQRIESLDAMPLLWAVNDALLTLDRLPAMARNLALERGEAGHRQPRPEVEHDDRRRGGPGHRGQRRRDLAALKERLTRHPLFLGHADRRRRDDDGAGGPAEEDARAQGDRDGLRAPRRPPMHSRRGTGSERPAVVGPPVLLADGFSAIEVNGRRLAAIGMILIGVVTLSAVRSVWWAIVPMLAGWVIWLATEEMLVRFDIRLALSGGPLVAQIIVLTMPAASHLAIHFRDDRRREADPRRAARVDAGLRRRADRLDGDHRRHRLWGAGDQRGDARPAVRRDPRHLHARRRNPRDADLADRHAPAVPPGGTGPLRLAIARSPPR